MKIKKYFYNASDIMKILEVSLSQAYKVIRELNEELKQKGIRVQRGKVAIEYFNERYKIAQEVFVCPFTKKRMIKNGKLK